MEMNSDIFTPDLPIPELVEFEDAPIPAPVEEEKPAETPPPRRRRKADAPVLTIESGDEIETEDAREAAAWHEIHNAYRAYMATGDPGQSSAAGLLQNVLGFVCILTANGIVKKIDSESSLF